MTLTTLHIDVLVLHSPTLTHKSVLALHAAVPISVATSMTLNATASEIDNRANTRFPVATSLSIDSGGEIEFAGQLQALPSVELQSTLNLSDIAISAVQPYVHEFAFLELESGSLDLEADLAIDSGEPFSFRGGAALRDVEISDQQLSETLFSMSSLGIDALSLSVANNELDISEVALENFFGLFGGYIFQRVVGVNHQSDRRDAQRIKFQPR